MGSKSGEKPNITGRDPGRADWLDLARFIAMVIVMMNHVGLHVPGVNYWGGMFYVPVFFMIAGFFWKSGGRRTEDGKSEPLKSVIGRKAKRLLVPFVVTNLVLAVVFLAKDILSGSFVSSPLASLIRNFGFVYGRNRLLGDHLTLLGSGSMPKCYFMTILNSPTWFLPALFLVFVYMELCARVLTGLEKEKEEESILDHKILLVIFLTGLCSVLGHYLTPLLLPWSIDAVPIFALLFYLGYQFGQKGLWDKLIVRPYLLFVLGGICVVGGLINGSANFSIGDYGTSMNLGILNAVTSSILFLYVCYLCRNFVPSVIAKCGQKTLPLLCWHYPVLAVMDSVILRFFAPTGMMLMILRGVEIAATFVIILAGQECTIRCRHTFAACKPQRY